MLAVGRQLTCAECGKDLDDISRTCESCGKGLDDMCDVDEAGEVAGCLVTNGPDDHAALPGNHFAVRDGLHHQPQPWHNGKMPKAKNKGKTPADQKKTSKVRRGIGQPLPRPKACKDWPKEPLQCAHEEDQLRQRGSKDSYWWTCLQCGSRWQRLEWEPDHEISAGAASSGDFVAPPLPK